MLISEAVRDRAKWMKSCDHPKKKMYLSENFDFWSCVIEKIANSLILVQKGLISERARAKRPKFWDHQRKKKRIWQEIFIFGHVTLNKVYNYELFAQKELVSKMVRARAKRTKF